MPVISSFYGIVVRMYFLQSEHNPPHVHAIYGNESVSIQISSGRVLDGEFPPRALKLVRKWIKLHKNELNQMWETQEFKEIMPLE